MPAVHEKSRTQSVVNVVAHTGWAWAVDASGFVTTSHPEDVPLGFSIEWHGDVFCLRWIATMQVLEAVPSSEESRGMLRAGKYECAEQAQFFEQRAKSIWSLGAQSYVNLREGLCVVSP